MQLKSVWGVLLGAVLGASAGAAQPILVLQSDFGLLDGAVASMKGVSVRLARRLRHGRPRPQRGQGHPRGSKKVAALERSVIGSPLPRSG